MDIDLGLLTILYGGAVFGAICGIGLFLDWFGGWWQRHM
jgi:hypothetical protein